jgi:hypothetical protein
MLIRPVSCAEAKTSRLPTVRHPSHAAEKDTIIIFPSFRPIVSVSHPAWRTAAATGLAYLVAIAALFVLLFVGPYVVFGVA